MFGIKRLSPEEKAKIEYDRKVAELEAQIIDISNQISELRKRQAAITKEYETLIKG